MKKSEFIKKYVKFVQEPSLINPKDLEWYAVTNDNNEYYLSLGKTIEDIKKDDSVIDMLAKYDITEFCISYENKGNKKHPVLNMGYSAKDNKWYGWSHRAVYGFGIGSTCVFGDCHYHAPNKEIYEKEMLKWYEPSDKEERTWFDIKMGERTKDGFHIIKHYTDKVPNKEIRNTFNAIFCKYPNKYGKGEWVAKTMDDAKLMATDFANAVN